MFNSSVNVSAPPPLTLWHGYLASEVIILVQTGVGHLLEPSPLQLRQVLDGHWRQPHAPPRQAAPGEVALWWTSRNEVSLLETGNLALS